jgi:hypothetical protein
MSFEVRVRFQIDDSDLQRTLGAYRRIHKVLRAAPDAPLAVELLRVVGDSHSFEERLSFRDRAHYDRTFTEYRREHPEIDTLYGGVPRLGIPDITCWEAAAVGSQA